MTREIIQGPPEGEGWAPMPDGITLEILEESYNKQIPYIVNGFGRVIETRTIPMNPVKTTRRWVRTWVEVHDEIWIDRD